MEFFTNLFGGNSNTASEAGGLGTYATFTGTNGVKTGLSKEAYDAAISAGHVDGLSKGFDNSSGLGNLLNSDTIKGLGTGIGIGTDIWGMMNQKKALKQAERQWEAENARANEIMAMNKEKYETYKADKARLNSQYA